jgi:hypothetical protein
MKNGKRDRSLSICNLQLSFCNFHCILALLCISSTCPAQTSLEVTRGWGGKQRAGRWNPVVVRVSDPVPRNVILELNSPHEGGFGMVIGERVAIGPKPATFEFYAPIHYSPWERSVLVLRDAESDRAIAQYPQHIRQGPPRLLDFGPQGIVIGVSGQRALLTDLTRYAIADTGYLPPRLLPRNAIGYDSLEVLFLNQVDLNAINPDQQRAILNWIRAGGSLLLSPGNIAIPSASAVAQALPCRIGDVRAIELSAQSLAQTGLKSRFSHISGHALEPLEWAHPLELFPGDHITAFSGRVGFGRIMVVPIDVAALEFEETQERQKSPAFWKPIIGELTTSGPSLERRKFNAPFHGYESESEDQQREGAAISTLCDFVGGPDAPSHGGGAAIFILAGILFVVGPVDSIVLRATGQRAFTWVTSGGWVGMIVVISIAVAGQARREPAIFRMVRVIDQADQTTVATDNLYGVFSARPAAYPIDSAAFERDSDEAWWQPATPGTIAPAEVKAQADFRFHQSDLGQAPERLAVAGGMTRFARSQSQSTSRPYVAASLTLQPAMGTTPARLSGTITNLSDRSLKNLRVRTEYGVISVPLAANGTLPPGQAAAIDVSAAGEPFDPQAMEGNYQNFGYFGSRHQQKAVSVNDLWAVAPDLSGRRSLQIDAMIGKKPDFACIYAEVVNPPPAAQFKGDARLAGEYYQWVRALVTLSR